jgi:hypothetical protein
MYLAIIGSRSFTDFELLEREILKHFKISEIECVLSGGAKGTDTLAEQFALTHHIPLKVFKPKWKEYGRKAGIIRNSTIVDECTNGIAFWDGISNGTKDTISKLKLANKEVITIIITNNE